MITVERGMNMIELLRNYFASLNLDKKGQDLTEYALLVALIALVVLIAIFFFGGAVSDFFVDLGATVESYLPP
jgi:Flp pilus assembly pilin Flp